MNTISIVVIDSNLHFRQKVADAISMEAGIHIIGMTANKDEGWEYIRRYRPDVAIVEMDTIEINGQNITSHEKMWNIETRMIFLAGYDNTRQKIIAYRSGARAYCANDIIPENLIYVIEEVAKGYYLLNEQMVSSTELKRWLSKQIESKQLRNSSETDPFTPLSMRKMEVLTYDIRGMSNTDIAYSLGISYQTVKNHVTSILRKINFKDRSQAAIFALRRGWVHLYQQVPDIEELV